MKNIYISLIIWFVCNTQIFGNTFFQGENFQFKSMMFLQDTTSENESEFQLETFKEQGSFKSPGKALLYSGVLPGMGQVYIGNWLRGLLFVGLDAIAIGTWYKNNNLAEEKKKEYSYYASEHWDFGRWVHDYYNWYEYEEGNDDWNKIRKAFINYSDTTNGCGDDPSLGMCYGDPWTYHHKIEFTYNGDIISSNSDDFKEVFQDLCGNTNSWDTDCSNEFVSLYDHNNDTIFVIKDHHFYEGIQKYNYYFAGWDDAVDSVKIVEKNGVMNAQTPNQQKYQALWNDYDNTKKLAVKGGSFMLINRVVSMVDALLIAKKWNNSNDMNLSLNAYPDLRNKSGLGGVKLSLYWK